MEQTSVLPPEFEPMFNVDGTAMLDREGRQMTRHNRDFFGYYGFLCERTIATDSIPMMRELIERGIVDRTTRCIDNASLVQYARRRKAKKVEAALRHLGWE